RYDRVVSLLDGRSLELYRASTVPRGWLASVRAKGKLTEHPVGQRLPVTRTKDALRELGAIADESRDDSAIRLLLIHHPMHAFRTGRIARGTTAAFTDRKEVARVIGRVPFHLVIDGHRHVLDPAEDGSYDAAHPAQKPLPYGCGQLVAESPTIEPVAFEDIEPPRETPRSFVVYRLHSNENGSGLNVFRRVFRYRRGDRQAFSPSDMDVVISNLGLE